MNQLVLEKNQCAPELPTTEMLQREFIVLSEGELCVQMGRRAVRQAYDDPSSVSAYGVGECGVVAESAEFRLLEGKNIMRFSYDACAFVMQRLNVWKPRSKADDWFGVETTDPEFAYRTVAEAVNQGVNVCMEIGYRQQLERYRELLTMAWVGARATEDLEKRQEIIDIFVEHHDIPLGIKNGQDGEIDIALELVEEINSARTQKLNFEGTEEVAPVFLIYRGGNNYDTPELVEEKIVEVIDRTEGKVMLDTAHSVEIAFDPEDRGGKPKQKTIAGQRAASMMITRLSEDKVFMGILAEASDIKGKTDPNMLPGDAFRAIYEIEQNKKKLQLSKIRK